MKECVCDEALGLALYYEPGFSVHYVCACVCVQVEPFGVLFVWHMHVNGEQF